MKTYRDVEEPSADARFFYVSCIDHDRRSLVKGPYSSHAAALADVRRVKDEAERHDPRSFWYAWGTAGSAEDLGPGVLGAPNATDEQVKITNEIVDELIKEEHEASKDLQVKKRSTPGATL